MLDTRAALVVCTTLAALLSAAGTGGAQPAERSLVVSVVDGDGAPVTGLQPRDFEVREDGAAREPPSCVVDTDLHAHGLAFDPANRFLFVPHTCPANAIFQLRQYVKDREMTTDPLTRGGH